MADGGLSLTREHVRRLVDRSSAELPNEACALLGGDEATGRVSSVHPARNRLASPYRYDVDADDLVRIIHEIEARGEELIAIFHSHPTTPAVPSPSDLREARYPVVQLIASMAQASPQVRAWRVSGWQAREVPLEVD